MRKSALALGLAVLCATSAAALDFKPYGRGAFAQIRASHASRPLIVHFWSVACPPCLAELSEWARLAREKTGVDIVFVNTDGDADRPRAAARLDKAGLKDAAHYGFADQFVERLYFEADPTWRGELPFTALIGADGGLVVTVTGAIDDPLITDWLAKRGTAAK